MASAIRSRSSRTPGRACPNSLGAPTRNVSAAMSIPASESLQLRSADIAATTDSGECVRRGVWRWADPDAGGSGVSGPTDNQDRRPTAGYIGKVINQNNYPTGGIRRPAMTILDRQQPGPQRRAVLVPSGRLQCRHVRWQRTLPRRNDDSGSHAILDYPLGKQACGRRFLTAEEA